MSDKLPSPCVRALQYAIQSDLEFDVLVAIVTADRAAIAKALEGMRKKRETLRFVAHGLQ